MGHLTIRQNNTMMDSESIKQEILKDLNNG